jgi:hypothetical protein
MTIPSVVQGTVETGDSKAFKLDSSEGSTWIESVNSFRFVPTRPNKPYTVRKELGKGGEYWYGYRRVAGKLQKKYIGRSSNVTTAKLEEIAAALCISPRPPVTEEVTKRVTDVTYLVTDEATENYIVDRLTALKLQLQTLEESFEALRDKLPKNEDLGNFPELPKSEIEVTEKELPNELGNLEVENEKLKVNYASLLESSTVITNKLRQELAEARSQLETERADREQVEAKLAELQEDSATASKDLPEAADLLNQLKAKRKKSTASLADIEVVLEIIEKFCDGTFKELQE